MGEATDPDRFTAGVEGAAGGLDFSFQNDLRFETHAGRNSTRQLAGVGDVFGNERFNSGLIRRSGSDPGKGEFFSGKAGGGGGEAQEWTITPGGSGGIAVDPIAELGAQGSGYGAELLAAGFDGVGERSRKIGQWIDFGAVDAQYVADGALAAVLAVDVGFELVLVGGELIL